MHWKLLRLKAKKATTLIFLLTTTGAAGLTYHQYSNLTPPPPHAAPTFSLFRDFSVCATAILRSSRALCTIGANVIDYKCTLHGLPLHSDAYQNNLSQVHLRSARRILKLCQGNKGFYVKAGQFVAALRQVPKEYSSTLSSLQDQAVPYNFQSIEAVLINNLGNDLSEIFLTFYETPIAAASIAQVHHAVLLDVHEVAIKVQYPDLELQMRLDTLTMSFLSRSVAWLFPEYRFEWAVSEFVMAISSELDFIQEAQNSERTANFFKNKKMFKVPRVFWEYTTSKVLTMELCKGNKVDDVEFLKEIGVNPVKVAKSLIEVFAEMIFIHGFLHGDPHPGNILVSPEGPDGFSLVLLDHGIYRELDDEFRKNYCQLWYALLLLDSKKIQQLGERFGVGHYSQYFPLIFTGRTIDSQSALGRGMTAEEKKKLKTELKSLKMEDISSFMESLPPDFLAIMRTERAWGYPSSTDVEEPPTIDVLSEGDANTEVHATPEECSPNYAGPGSSVSEVLWQDSVDPDNMTYEELLDLGEAIGTQSRGLPLELINMLPTSRYKAGRFFSRKKSKARQEFIIRLATQL